MMKRQTINNSVDDPSTESSINNISRFILSKFNIHQERFKDANNITEIAALSISSQCLKLTDILYYNAYSLQLFEILNTHGYKQIIEFVIDKTQLPLYNSDEEDVLDKVLTNTIDPKLIEVANNENHEYGSKSVGILILLNSMYDLAKGEKINQLRNQMDDQVLNSIPFGKYFYFRKFKSIEREVNELGLSDEIAQSDILGKAFHGIYKSKSGYRKWASKCLNNDTTLGNVHSLFDDLDHMEKDVTDKSKSKFRLWFQLILPWIFIISTVFGFIILITLLVTLAFFYLDNTSLRSTTNDSDYTQSDNETYQTGMPTLPDFDAEESGYLV